MTETTTVYLLRHYYGSEWHEVATLGVFASAESAQRATERHAVASDQAAPQIQWLNCAGDSLEGWLGGQNYEVTPIPFDRLQGESE